MAEQNAAKPGQKSAKWQRREYAKPWLTGFPLLGFNSGLRDRKFVWITKGDKTSPRAADEETARAKALRTGSQPCKLASLADNLAALETHCGEAR